MIIHKPVTTQRNVNKFYRSTLSLSTSWLMYCMFQLLPRHTVLLCILINTKYFKNSFLWGSWQFECMKAPWGKQLSFPAQTRIWHWQCRSVNSKVNLALNSSLFHYCSSLLMVKSQIQKLHTCLPTTHSCTDLTADPTICKMQQSLHEEIQSTLKKQYFICQVVHAPQKRHPIFGTLD